MQSIHKRRSATHTAMPPPPGDASEHYCAQQYLGKQHDKQSQRERLVSLIAAREALDVHLCLLQLVYILVDA